MPEYYIEGLNGRGPVNYAIKQAGTVSLVGVTEVKDDFDKGVAQNMVQAKTILDYRKREAEGMSDDTPTDSDTPKDSGIIKRFGVITDDEIWKFLECYCHEDGPPQFKLSKEYRIYMGESQAALALLKENVKTIMEIIAWFLSEAIVVAVLDKTQTRSRKWMEVQMTWLRNLHEGDLCHLFAIPLRSW